MAARPEVVQDKQAADAVGVGVAFVSQSPDLAMRAARVLLLDARFAQHRPDASFAAVMAQQQAQQLVAVDPIGLGAPRVPVHFDAGRIDHDVVDALLP